MTPLFTDVFLFEPYFFAIYAAAFLTAIVSASLGFIGGTLLLAFMAQFLKMDALIPIHGIIQLSSNVTRAYVLRNHINWLITKETLIGTIIGGIAGYFYIVQIPENWFNLGLGVFILLVTWLPKPQVPFTFKGKWLLIGVVCSSLGLMVGAIGIIVGTLILAEKLDKKTMVGTQATMQSLTHLAKVIVFSFLGFSLVSWTWLILGALLATYLGTLIGTRILNHIPEKLFRKILTGILSALAIKLIVSV